MFSLFTTVTDTVSLGYLWSHLREKQSPESLFGKITGLFFVICWPERFDGNKQEAIEQN